MNGMRLTLGDMLALYLMEAMLAPPGDGKHKHRCECGCIWEHPDSRSGDDDAHACPACNEMLPPPWWKYEGDHAPCYVEGPDGLPMAA